MESWYRAEYLWGFQLSEVLGDMLVTTSIVPYLIYWFLTYYTVSVQWLTVTRVFIVQTSGMFIKHLLMFNRYEYIVNTTMRFITAQPQKLSMFIFHIEAHIYNDGIVCPLAYWLLTCWNIPQRVRLLEEQVHTSLDISTTNDDRSML